MGANGALQQTQLFGPPNVEEWMAAFAVFRTGAIMLGQISPATLDLWINVVTGYAARYGPQAWALVYQTEVRARLEHMERVRRNGAAARRAALAAGGTHPFNPDLPWEWVFRQTAEDNKFWHRELEEPALLVKTRADKIDECVEDYAPLSRATGRRSSPGPPASDPPPPRKKPRSSADRVHRVDSDGYFTHNRRGAPLCQAYQKGACENNGFGGNCPKNPGHVHQCSKCLHLGHGLHQCMNETAKD